MILDHCRQCEAVITNLDEECPKCGTRTRYDFDAHDTALMWSFAISIIVVVVCSILYCL